MYETAAVPDCPPGGVRKLRVPPSVVEVECDSFFLSALRWVVPNVLQAVVHG